MKQFKLLILLLVIGFVAQSQTNYLPMKSRYRWIAGKFDSTVTIPYGLTPSIRTGGFTGPASLFFKTSDSTVYVYTGTQWISVKGAGGSADSTIFATLYRVDTAKTNIRTTLNSKIDSLRRSGLNVQAYKNGTWVTQYTDSVGSAGSADGYVDSVRFNSTTNILTIHQAIASDQAVHLPTETLNIDSTFTPLAGQVNDSTWVQKSLRIQAGDTTINPDITDTTVNINIPMIHVDTSGVTHNMVAYWDTAGVDKVKFREETAVAGSGAFSVLGPFRVGDENAPGAGDTVLQHTGFRGKMLFVYRGPNSEGARLQEHAFADTGYNRVNDSTIWVKPAFAANEWWQIEARDSTSYTQLTLQAPSAGPPLLLDTYTSATGAYSLRKLRTLYTGHAIKVRRSSDNTTQDIDYLSSGYLDTASMKTFVSTGTGYIDTWYDQSTNGYDLTQATTGNQPVIIESGGTVYRTGGDVAIKFTSASSHYLTNTSITGSSLTDAYIAQVFKSNSAAGNYIPFGASGQNFAYQHGSASNRMYAYVGNVYGDFPNSSTSLHLSETVYDGGGSGDSGKLKYYLNTAAQTAASYSGTVPSTVSFTGLSLGRLYAVGVYFDGATSEFIIWGNDKSADRTSIEANINAFYNAF